MPTKQKEKPAVQAPQEVIEEVEQNTEEKEASKETEVEVPFTSTNQGKLEELYEQKAKVQKQPKSDQRDHELRLIRAKIRKLGGSGSDVPAERQPKTDSERRRAESQKSVGRDLEQQIAVLENRLAEGIMYLQPHFGKSMDGAMIYQLFRILSPAVPSTPPVSPQEVQEALQVAINAGIQEYNNIENPDDEDWEDEEPGQGVEQGDAEA